MMHNCIHITIPVNKSIVPVPELSAISIGAAVVMWINNINRCYKVAFTQINACSDTSMSYQTLCANLLTCIKLFPLVVKTFPYFPIIGNILNLKYPVPWLNGVFVHKYRNILIFKYFIILCKAYWPFWMVYISFNISNTETPV